MRKWIISFAAAVLIMIAAGACLVGYISPQEKLDLTYAQVPMRDRVVAMIKRQSLELVLTSDDLNNLAKRAIAQQQGKLLADTVITGARFTLVDQQLKADVNIKYKDLISAGMQMTYAFEWRAPNLIATVIDAKVRALPIPAERFDPITFPITDNVPKFIHIRDVKIEEGRLHIRFQKPKLSDLREIF